MRSLQLGVLFALLATVARGDELLPITTHITSSLTGGFYTCGVSGGDFRTVRSSATTRVLPVALMTQLIRPVGRGWIKRFT